jgi:hypothetical protein
MSRRNIWLSFEEWELICNEINQEHHPFQLSDLRLKEWKEDIKSYHDKGYTHGEPQYCFKRVGIDYAICYVTSPRALNILCRENWRDQDMVSMMVAPFDFIGYIINYIVGVDMDTPYHVWDEIRIQMLNVIRESDKTYWYDQDIISLYKQVVSNQTVEA